MRYILFGIFLSFINICSAQQFTWFPPQSGLLTEWGTQIDFDKFPDAYPRPTMEREAWSNLNGIWHFALNHKDSSGAPKFNRQIMVPFPVESSLSGVGIKVSPTDKMWYKKKFYIPEDWSYKYILLHFGAVDWEANIYVNGEKAGTHRGGYAPFTLDITFYLKEKGMQELVVEIWDPTDSYHQPRGKQSLDPEAIWYTSVSGIWQTVWIEPVKWASVKDIDITTDIDHNKAFIDVQTFQANDGDSVICSVIDKKNTITTDTLPIKQNFVFTIPKPKLWSPDNPHLYDVSVKLLRSGEIIDEVSSYFGMRKIEVKDDKNGIKRIFLNNKPIFQLGLLDQGWWPDGLYTAPSDEALKYDILKAKELGYNLLRKHVKVEPERWYYHCDKIGMLVWQDMPNGDEHAPWEPPSGIPGKEIERSFRSGSQYKLEFKEIIDANKDHPSIIMWVPFNEGWGQFKTEEITKWVMELDTTRLVSGPSGGNYFPVGHTRDFHSYPGPAMPPPDPDRALVLSEFGGLGLPIKNHTWEDSEKWGYKNLDTKKDYNQLYIGLMEKLNPLIVKGLNAAIYTQITDVEGEINGIMTYDRKALKLKSNKVEPIHKALINSLK